MAEMSLTQQAANFKNSLAKKLKEAAFLVEGEMHRIVAVDTGALDKSIKTDDVVDRGNLLSVDVGSEGIFYAIYVDQGVGGKVYNYHKRSGAGRQVIYSGVGQHWVERSLVKMEDQISAKLREAKIG
jgi:hypothetical protein